jgi:hypothetical protein
MNNNDRSLVFYYTGSQIANLPKKRRKLNKLIDRVNKERAGKNRRNVIDRLNGEIWLKMNYLFKDTPKTVQNNQEVKSL